VAITPPRKKRLLDPETPRRFARRWAKPNVTTRLFYSKDCEIARKKCLFTPLSQRTQGIGLPDFTVRENFPTTALSTAKIDLSTAKHSTRPNQTVFFHVTGLW